jgi:CO/xanthine dehydrogenase Mo-binding subunit
MGTDVPRREGAEKLTGEAVYLDDLPREGVWLGGTVRASGPRGRLRRIVRDPSFPDDRAVLVTAEDIPGENVIPLFVDDQPALVESEIRHPEEPVALVAAPDAETLAVALGAIRLETDQRPPVLDLDEALAAAESGDAIFPPDNVFKCIEIVKGDTAAGGAAADAVVEGEYTFGAQEHVYIEPQAVQAEWTDDGIVIRGSLQCPYYVAHGLTRVLDLPLEKVRVIQTTTGGGFGGKEEYPTMLAAHAALLARTAGRPVRMAYGRSEDMLATTKRHPGRVRHRTGLRRDGRIVAMDIDVVLDGGAYCTLSPVVLSRGAIHAAGPYDVPNVRTLARVVATNHPPSGAFRGFGAPQTIFALETHLDRCAAELGVDPIDLRRRNLLRTGGTLATGQDLGDDVAVEDVFETALAKTRFLERRSEHARFNAEAKGHEGADRFLRRGIGLSLFMHGAGFTGSGEVTLASEVQLVGTPDGTVTALTAQTEIGQGTRTILAQTAADGVGLPVEKVRTMEPDTAVVPDSGPTVASRTAMVIGGLLLRAGRELREVVERRAGRELPDPEEFCAEVARLSAEGPLQVSATYSPPEGVHWDEETYRGDAYASFAWACDVAEVEVDLLTGETRVLGVTAVQEVGRVINPVLATGQIEGGVAQGIGWALLEDVVWEKGRMKNANLTDYVLPTSVDTPPIEVVFLERPHPRAPHGAKGIGELPMDGPAPAIVNALRQAIGAELSHVPATPERILTAIPEEEPG